MTPAATPALTSTSTLILIAPGALDLVPPHPEVRVSGWNGQIEPGGIRRKSHTNTHSETCPREIHQSMVYAYYIDPLLFSFKRRAIFMQSKAGLSFFYNFILILIILLYITFVLCCKTILFGSFSAVNILFKRLIAIVYLCYSCLLLYLFLNNFIRK
mgnify:CR=1 FL=1